MTLKDGPRLIPNHATAALLVTEDGRYLLQLRDPIPSIFFPGYWGCFGGAVELGETPESAMRREIIEELSFDPPNLDYFSTLTFDFGFAGLGAVERHFFLAPIEEQDLSAMTLGEGADMRLFDGDQILTMAKIVPYDATVIWQHMSQARF